jgi:WD40 repeat protein
VSDAWRFAQTYGTLIEEHPLLVYASALPFTPITSTIYQLFHDPFTYLTVAGGFQQSWSALLHVISANSVVSVAFSPDGTRIVSGSDDETVRVWDTVSGAEALPPLRGHENGVTSVAFSPDGTRIVSGSDDKTVRVWDTVSGAEALSPLRGHKNWVISVAFSPDGTRIVSGSHDNTVRVWDTVSGAEALPPLRGHESGVNSVTFSPDGTRIISRSYDNIVCVWDTATGCLYAQNGTHDDRFKSHSILLNSDGRILDLYTKRTISKLPAMIAPSNWGISGKSIAIGTYGGQVIILKFPQASFSSPETRPTKAEGAV